MCVAKDDDIGSHQSTMKLYRFG